MHLKVRHSQSRAIFFVSLQATGDFMVTHLILNTIRHRKSVGFPDMLISALTLYCVPQQASTCFRHQISISSMVQRFTPTLKLTHRAPVPVTAMSQNAAQMEWKMTVSPRRLESSKWTGRRVSETQYNVQYPMRPHHVCRETVLLKRHRAPQTFKCKEPSQQSTNCLFYICTFVIFLSHQPFYCFS